MNDRWLLIPIFVFQDSYVVLPINALKYDNKTEHQNNINMKSTISSLHFSDDTFDPFLGKIPQKLFPPTFW